MLYRLTPPAGVTWADTHWNFLEDLDRFRETSDQPIDLDRLDWKPTEDRQFSRDLLRIALRHGVATPTGIAVDVKHVTDLGRADQLRFGQQAIGELQADIKAQSGELMEHLMPGWTEHGEELDQRVRDSTERAARQADQAVAAVLAAPVAPDLAEHWLRLGGQLPDEA